MIFLFLACLHFNTATMESANVVIAELLTQSLRQLAESEDGHDGVVTDWKLKAERFETIHEQLFDKVGKVERQLEESELRNKTLKEDKKEDTWTIKALNAIIIFRGGDPAADIEIQRKLRATRKNLA